MLGIGEKDVLLLHSQIHRFRKLGALRYYHCKEWFLQLSYVIVAQSYRYLERPRERQQLAVRSAPVTSYDSVQLVYLGKKTSLALKLLLLQPMMMMLLLMIIDRDSEFLDIFDVEVKDLKTSCQCQIISDEKLPPRRSKKEILKFFSSLSRPTIFKLFCRENTFMQVKKKDAQKIALIIVPNRGSSNYDVRVRFDIRARFDVTPTKLKIIATQKFEIHSSYTNNFLLNLT